MEEKKRPTQPNIAIRGGTQIRVAHEFMVNPLEQVVASVPWRNAIDVWGWGITVTETKVFGSIWKLYAVSGQVRLLVAKNNASFSGAGSPSPEFYAMGCRNIICDRFEVTVQQQPFQAPFPIPSVAGKVSIAGFGVEPSGKPRGFPSPQQILTRQAGIGFNGGEWGGGATRFFDRGLIENNNIAQAPALLVEATGFSSRAGTTRWVHLFGFYPAPADGAVNAQYIIQVPAGASFSYAPTGGEFYPHDLGENILPAGATGPGLSYAVSTTDFALTRELVGTLGIDVGVYGVP